jgi:hypothetical protein
MNAISKSVSSKKFFHAWIEYYRLAVEGSRVNRRRHNVGAK